ncbi:hypothetical protein GIB67_031291 [Kingdonia uniflora]|uniref:Uncharacterized protein n=1 Tax=Kingdonia uniflora TaxID=39325 RepID=A0A7J7P5N5_9MAGN|nr:hypothetical protein GIB67_031291 [Kingdonia uniflora]
MGNPHAIVIPYPMQGHLIAHMKLSRSLVKRGFKVTFVNTKFSHKDGITCVITDMGWAMDVAEKMDIEKAAFWTVSAGTLAFRFNIEKLFDMGVIDLNGGWRCMRLSYRRSSSKEKGESINIVLEVQNTGEYPEKGFDASPTLRQAIPSMSSYTTR